jgi:hypothetical protein
MGYQVFPTPFIEEAILFSIELTWHLYYFVFITVMKCLRLNTYKEVYLTHSFEACADCGETPWVPHCVADGPNCGST